MQHHAGKSIDRDFGNRIRDRRKQLGFTQRHLADLIGVHESYISKLEKGSGHLPKFETLRKLAAALKDDPKDYLALRNLSPADTPPIYIGPAVREIPLLGMNTLKDWKNLKNLTFPKRTAIETRFTTSTDPNAFFVQIDDDCMEPHIMPGDIVLVEPALRIENGHIVLTALRGSFLIRVIEQIKGFTFLKATNPRYPTITIECKDNIPIPCFRISQIVKLAPKLS